MEEFERIEKKPRGGARKGSGMKKGQKTQKTIEKEEARKAYQQLVLQNLRPLFGSQLSLARGVSYVYRIDRHYTKGSPVRVEHVLLEDPREIADALDIIENADPNGTEDGNGFYYVTTKAPENRAIDSLLDRALDKSKQVTDVTSDGKAILGNAIVFSNFKDETDSK